LSTHYLRNIRAKEISRADPKLVEKLRVCDKSSEKSDSTDDEDSISQLRSIVKGRVTCQSPSLKREKSHSGKNVNLPVNETKKTPKTSVLEESEEESVDKTEETPAPVV
jgi:hypothetical protein